MTEIEPTDSSTGRRRFFVRAIVAFQATIGAAVAFVFGATTLLPSFLRRQDTWLRAADLKSLPARIGLHFLAARKEDQCVAFRLHL